MNEFIPKAKRTTDTGLGLWFSWWSTCLILTKPWVWFSVLCNTECGVCSWNPNTEEVEAGRTEVQHFPWL